MVFLLSGIPNPAPREVTQAPSFSNDGGWLLRFFDSAFFCEWIAVTYLYRHEHGGVRDYLCNRMYTLPVPGMEDYLFQLCHMAVQKPSPSLEKYIIDACSKSLRLSLKVHWFLQAEGEDIGDDEDIRSLQDNCQMAALEGGWPPLTCPNPPTCMLSGRGRMMRLVSSASRRLLPLSTPGGTSSRPAPTAASAILDESGPEVAPGAIAAADPENSMKLLRKLIPGPKVQQMREAFFRKFMKEEGGEEEMGSERAIMAGSLELMGGGTPVESTTLKENLLKYFRRREGEKGEGEGEDAEEAETPKKDSFYTKYFRKGKEGDLEEGGEGEDVEVSLESAKSKEVFFGKFFWKGSGEKGEEGEIIEDKGRGGVEDSPVTDSLFKRLWGERRAGEEVDSEDTGAHVLAERGRTKSWRLDDEGFFRKLFGGKGEELAPEEKKLIGELRAVVEAHGGMEGDEKSFFWGLLGLKGDTKLPKGDKAGEEKKGMGEEPVGLERQGSFLGKLGSNRNSVRFSVRTEETQDGGSDMEEESASEGYFRRFIRGRGEESDKGEVAEKAEKRMKLDHALVERGSSLASADETTAASNGVSDPGGHEAGHVSEGDGSRGLGQREGGQKVGEDKVIGEVNEVEKAVLGAVVTDDASPGNEGNFFRKLLFRRVPEEGAEKGLVESGVGERSGTVGSVRDASEGGIESVGVLERTSSGKVEKGVGDDCQASENKFLSSQLRKIRSSIANAAGVAVSLTHQGTGGNEEFSLRLPLTPTKKRTEEVLFNDRTSGAEATPERRLEGAAGRECTAEKVGEKFGGEESGAVGESSFLRKLNPFRAGGNSGFSLTLNLSVIHAEENGNGSGLAAKVPLTPRKERHERVEVQASSPGQSVPTSSGSFLRKLWREKGEDEERKGGVDSEEPSYVPLVDPPAPSMASGGAGGGGAKGSTAQKPEGAGGGRLSFIGNPLRSATLLVVGAEKGRKENSNNANDGPGTKFSVQMPDERLPTGETQSSNVVQGGNAATPATTPPKKAMAGLLPLVRSFSAHSAEPPSPTRSNSGSDSAALQSSRPGSAGPSLGLSLSRNFGVGLGQTLGFGGAGGGGGGGGGGAAMPGSETAARPSGPVKVPKAAAVVPEPDECSIGEEVGRAGRESAEDAKEENMAALNHHGKVAEGLAGVPAGGGAARPPFPRYPSFTIRKGTFHASLDFVKALCDISMGLVNVFPLSDRQKALKESLAELNAHLEAGSNHGGVCFPMGKQLTRVMHILEDEALLLNSRERVPFMVFVEVLRCDPLSLRKVEGEGPPVKLTKSGIPLANGDAKLPRPPPWALHMWNAQGKMGGEGGHRSLPEKKAWEGETVKVVDVSLVVRKCRGRKASVWWNKGQCEIGMPRETRGARRRLKYGEEAEELDVAEGGEAEVPREEDEGERETRQGSSCRDEAAEGDSREGGGEVAMDKERNAEGNGVFLMEKVNGGDEGRGLRERETQRREEEKEETMSETSGSDGSDSSGEWDGAALTEGEEWVTVKLVAVPGLMMDDVAAMADKGEGLQSHRRVPSSVAMEDVRAEAAQGKAPKGLRLSPNPEVAEQEAKAEAKGKPMTPSLDHPFGELWADRRNRIRKSSKYGSSSDWDLKSMIVKSGDDCRQEHLAVQLMSHVQDIFTEAELPLWLRPYEVIVTSSNTALIETIPDAVSIHSLKNRNPTVGSLREYFNLKYGSGGEFRAAQKNFVESMAGYSIFCYLMQVKDRHNGNIMLDKDGRIIHIDFGFMLSNSPGGVNFENAPFKLTRELLEVMDSDAEGVASEAFDYFKVLCIQGFLTCRKHAERILLLVEMMQHSGCKCFKAGPRTIHNLRKRFHLTHTEEQCVSLVLELINSSLDAWRTRQYDYYQRVLNGIL